MSRTFKDHMREVHAALSSAEYQLHTLGHVQRAAQAARRARSFLSVARMELAREVVHEIDSGIGIATAAQWALATKILKPLRLAPRAKGRL